jgi:hypothetical protein
MDVMAELSRFAFRRVPMARRAAGVEAGRRAPERGRCVGD